MDWRALGAEGKQQQKSPAHLTLKTYFLLSVLTFAGSLAVASHLLFTGFLRGTHSPPWSKEMTDCTESPGTRRAH